MSTFEIIEEKCAVCGVVQQVTVCTSSYSFGADLDFRPLGMAREDLGNQAVECFRCGYVSRSISDPTGITKEFLNSEEYLTCDGYTFKSFLAERFYKRYKICLAENNRSGAMYALIHAAWSSDDEEDHENAVLCRKLAIPYIDEIHDTMETSYEQVKLFFAYVDFLRRTERFGEVIRLLEGHVFEDPFIQKVVDYQIEKSKAGDAGYYTLFDADPDCHINIIHLY